MVKVIITLEGELEEMKHVDFRDLFDCGEKPSSVDLFESDETLDDGDVTHRITGFEKEGPNWKIMFDEYPHSWTIPCTERGSGNREEFGKALAFFEKDINAEESNEVNIKLKEPVKCHVTMQKHERGKFKGEWVWTKIVRV